MIAQETIQKIREANEITEVIATYLPSLKKSGKDFKALCPFHQEKTPSFTVSSSKGIFYCFGCGQGGDLFKFVMQMEGCSYLEAIEKLAERKGIPIRKESGASFSKNLAKRKALLECLERAAQFYHKTLLTSEEARPARNYLINLRKLKEETIEKFMLGWAPSEGSALAQLAIKAGFLESDLMRAGLLVRSQKNNRTLDWFRGRIIFPILNAKGEVIAFGGRILHQDKDWENPPPKYLNSPETEVFQKSRNLYGLFQALRKIREKNEVILVEGYMDVISCHQAGIENTVAPLGTSLALDHCQLLARYADPWRMGGQVTLLFDKDAAGQSASFRAAEHLFEFGFLPTMVRLEDGKDVDEFLRNHSVAELLKAIADKQNALFVLLETLLDKNRTLPEEIRKVAALRELFPYLKKVQSAVAQDSILRELSKRLNLSLESITREWQKLEKKNPGVSRPAHLTPEALEKETLPKNHFLSLQEELLCLAIAFPTLRKKFIELSACYQEHFSDPKFQESISVLKNAEPGEIFPEGNFLNRLSEPASNWASRLLLQFSKITLSHPELLFESLIKRLEQKDAELKFSNLRKQVAKQLNEGCSGRTSELSNFQELASMVKGGWD